MPGLALQPISGLAYGRHIIQPEADPHSMHGGPVDPKHGQIGETAEPYPWIEFIGPHGPYGPAEDALLSDEPESRTLPAGNMSQDPSGDATPYRTHGGPHITGFRMDRGPDGNAGVLAQSYAAHSVDTGAADKGRASSNPANDPWTMFWNPVQGDDLVPELPKATGPSVFGFGNNDRTSNPFHKSNSFQLNTAHRMRRYSRNLVPGNWMWLAPAGRPMNKTLAGPARPATGEGPFYGQDITETYGYEGAILMQPATSYQTPPLPYTTPPASAGDTVSSPVIELW